MELLLRGGADASVVDANGRTAEEVAAEYRRIRATVCLHSIHLSPFDLYSVFRVHGDQDLEKHDYLVLRPCCVGGELQKVLEDWRQGHSDLSLSNRSRTDSRAEWRYDQWGQQATDEGDTLFNGWNSGRLSSEELDRERGQELRDWKEQRVDEAVALIRVSSAAPNVDGPRHLADREKGSHVSAMLRSHRVGNATRSTTSGASVRDAERIRIGGLHLPALGREVLLQLVLAVQSASLGIPTSRSVA